MTALSLISKRELLIAKRPTFPVLIIDDDPVFQTLMHHYLVDSGYQITVCEGAEEGLALLREKTYKLIVCDWLMPGMSGLQMCQRLRSIETEYHYFILMTGKNSDEDLIQGFQAGADDYIRKSAPKLEVLARLDAGLRVLLQQEELLRQRQEIERQALTDVLTGCFNRRYLMSAGEKEMKRVRRYDEKFSIIMCDVDFFKSINDSKGHQAGDVVLQAIAQNLMVSVREGLDVVCRYGGEEFAILLPNTPAEQAALVAEKLRMGIEQLCVIWQETAVPVTMSFGVAAAEAGSETRFEELLSQADQALYLAKEQGRNRVIRSQR